MAVIAKTVTNLQFRDDNRCHVVAWGAMATSDTGQPEEMPSSSDRSIQFGGTFGGATVVLEGSNDGTTYFTLTDPQGNPISKTSAALEQISELTRYVRPSVSGGTGVAITATMFVKRVR